MFVVTVLRPRLFERRRMVVFAAALAATAGIGLAAAGTAGASGPNLALTPCSVGDFGSDGYGSDGFNRLGEDRSGYDRDGYDLFGYDRFGKDRFGHSRFDDDQSGTGNAPAPLPTGSAGM